MNLCHLEQTESSWNTRQTDIKVMQKNMNLFIVTESELFCTYYSVKTPKTCRRKCEGLLDINVSDVKLGP